MGRILEGPSSPPIQPLAAHTSSESILSISIYINISYKPGIPPGLASARKPALHAVTAEQGSRAWAWLRRRDEREYSFVDATSFEVMRARRLRQVLALDDDFTAAGFVEMRHQPVSFGTPELQES